jgi:hypothetical protein
MTAIVLPTTSMPGQRPQESGGRLINCFVESLGETAGTPFKLLRAPGLRAFGPTNESGFRGGFQAGALIYTAWSGKLNTFNPAGGAGTDLAGTLTGSDPVFFARNNKATPDLVIVSPDNGAFVATTSAVSAYPDADVGAPNSVCFLKGFFIFGYGTGAMRATGLNSTAINTLDTATAESRPDTLYRVLARGDTLIAAGGESIEFWGINGEATGFPFSPITTHDRGIAGRYAIGGHEEGFGHGIFFVADDFTVRQLEGFTSLKISPPDLDRLIEAVPDKSSLQVSVYVTQGHPFVAVSSENFTWEYDVILQRWHERKSYNLTRWRGTLPFKGFDRWLCGDTESGNMLVIDTATRKEADAPLVCEVETGPMGNFPYGARVNRLDLFVAAGAGLAQGDDPVETDPAIDIFISRDLGLSWSDAWRRRIGGQGRSPNVTVSNLGHCGPKGVKLKFRFADPVHFALMGGDLQFQPLRN